MKKFLAIAIFCLLGTGAFAQTNKGAIVVLGSTGFSKTSQDSDYAQAIETSTTSFNITPGIGYMLLTNLEVGATLGYTYNGTRQESDDKANGVEYTSKLNTFNFGAYTRKYFVLSDKFALTALASAVISKGTSTVEFTFPEGFSGTSELEVNNYRISLVPGATFFLNDKVGINASFGSLGFAKFTTEPKAGGTKSETTQVGLDLNSSTLSLGFSYYISR